MREDYPDLTRLRHAAPKLIVEHNLYGVDIDPRCAQIAALALWLRAERAWKDLGVTASERARIHRTHIVVAEPMPGDAALVDEFAARLDPPLHAVWARRSSEDPWFCEFLINEHHDRDWIFRGQPIERPLDSIGLIIDGLPVLCPEIVLLYKSEEPEANSADMRAAWPYLSTESSEWLKTSLRVLDARHPWLQPPRSGY